MQSRDLQYKTDRTCSHTIYVSAHAVVWFLPVEICASLEMLLALTMLCVVYIHFENNDCKSNLKIGRKILCPSLVNELEGIPDKKSVPSLVWLASTKVSYE